MIEIHGDLVIAQPDIFVKGIASILDHASNQHVVLVHALDDHIAADQVTAIVATAKRVLPRAMHHRLKVSHLSWGRDNLLWNPTQAYLSGLRHGIDPWDDGYVPAVLLAD